MSSVQKNFPSTIAIAVFLVACALSAVSAQMNLDFLSQNDLESIEEIQDLLRTVQQIFEMKIASKVRDGIDTDGENYVTVDGTGCTYPTWTKISCCLHIDVSRFGLHGDCCVTLAVHLHNLSAMISVTFGDHVLFHKEVSARHPPLICHHFPAKKKKNWGVGGCIQFYNLGLTSRSFKGCAKLLFRVFYITVLTYDIGCFQLHFRNAIGLQNQTMLHLEESQYPVERPEPVNLYDVLMYKMKPGA